MDTWEHGPVEGSETTTTRLAGWHTPGRVSGPGRQARREGLGLKAAARPGAKAPKTLRAGQWPGVARPRVRWLSAVGHAWCAAVLAGAAASTHVQKNVPPDQSWGVQINLYPLTGFWIHNAKAVSVRSGGAAFSLRMEACRHATCGP